ncbi:MAG TPA: hypothetical protein VGM37_01340 [Armatimonadota bacterium]|jgi:hypothetical protein
MSRSTTGSDGGFPDVGAAFARGFEAAGDAGKRPRGKAINWTDEEIAAMSTPEAMMEAAESAAELWRQSASPEFADLLDAEEA